MRKAITALSLATTLFIPGISYADELSYDYAEVQYYHQSPAPPMGHLTGYSLFLYKSVFNNIYLLFNYHSGNAKNPLGDLDASGFALGAGYHTPINNKLDVFTEFSGLKSDAKRAGISIDAKALNIGVGLRSKLTSKIEGAILIDYTDINFKDSRLKDRTDSSINIKIAYEISQSMQITGGADFEDKETLTVGMRFNF